MLLENHPRESYQAIADHDELPEQRTTRSTPSIIEVTALFLLAITLFVGNSHHFMTNDFEFSGMDISKTYKYQHHHKRYKKKNKKVTKILKELDKIMDGKVLFQKNHDEEFTKATHVWKEAGQLFAPPIAVVLPFHESDVSLAVPRLAKLLSDHGVPFRIRSGGHSLYNPDQSTVSKGIVLSLSYLNKSDFDPDTKVATVGPNTKVEDMLRNFQMARNYSTTIGFCPSVAEGGYLGGGGWGPSHRVHGLGIDNVLELRAVLPNGTAVTSSAYVNSDLFWALRGGGHGTLAIMTEFKLQLHPILDSTPLVTGIVPWSAVPSFFYTLGEMDKNDGVARRVFLLVEGCEEQGLPIRLGYVPSDDATLQEGSTTLKKLMQALLPPDESDEETMSGMYSFSYETVSWTKFSTTPEMYYDGYLFNSWFGFLHPEDNTMDSWVKIANALHHIGHLNHATGDAMTKKSDYIFFEVDLFGGATADVDPADTAFFHRNALFNVGVHVGVPSNTKHAKKIFEKLLMLVGSAWETLQREGFFRGVFSNYQMQSLSKEEYPHQYWGGNLEKLQSIKALYDPDNVFRHSQSIPPSSLKHASP